MGGFKPNRKTYRLVFEDEDLAGLEVVMRSLTVESMTKLAAAADAVKGDSVDVAAIEDLFGRFAATLKEWNVVDDDGKPVPATAGGVMSQDLDFVMAVFEAYFEAVTGVNPPSPAASPGGGTSGPERSLPMAPRSPGPPSS
jgi:hypothetical protein